MSVERVLTVAYAFQNWTESGKDNHGQAVEIFLKFVWLKAGQPWCAAFVSYVGWYGCYNHVTKKSTWPVPRTGGCAVLGDYAKQHALLERTPEVGDVFLIWFPALNRFAHTGFITQVHPDGSCTTLEGNTNTDGSRNGWGVFERTRTFKSADRFVRWTKVLPKPS